MNLPAVRKRFIDPNEREEMMKTTFGEEFLGELEAPVYGGGPGNNKDGYWIRINGIWIFTYY